jgi:hypothetical protein
MEKIHLEGYAVWVWTPYGFDSCGWFDNLDDAEKALDIYVAENGLDDDSRASMDIIPCLAEISADTLKEEL